MGEIKMLSFRNIQFIAIYMLISLSLSGCIMFHDTPESQAGVTPIIIPEQDNAAANRFQEPSPEGPTPVETAIEISEKYVKLTEEASLLREQNNQLNKQNNELITENDNLNTTLSQTEQELKEANDMLIDMRIELNNWKVDVLSFRDEMRNADKAELQALLKILKTLGGDMNIEDSTLANEILSEPNEPQT
jgi:DNA anti-recombination protein RmuC